MKKFIFISLLMGFLSLGTFAQSDSASTAAKKVPENFKSDGCSIFFDGCYRDCCVEHDKAYYFGGPRQERRKADKLLFKCVAGKKGWWHKVVASMMWAGVRVGGVGFLPTPFRWGFGQKKAKKTPDPQPEEIKKKNEVSKLTEKTPPD